MHVNAVVNTLRGHHRSEREPFPPFNRKLVVDFNQSDFREKYPMHPVGDRYAVALFYNNLGAEALGRQDYAASFALLREAARTHPDMPGPWVNLGVLYARYGHYDVAEAAYLRALETDPGQQSALANLVSVYAWRGDTALVEEYRLRIQALSGDQSVLSLRGRPGSF